MKKPKYPGFDAPFLDKEEEEIFRAVERGEYVERVPRAQALKEWQQAVRNTLRKKPITVRDIPHTKAKAHNPPK